MKKLLFFLVPILSWAQPSPPSPPEATASQVSGRTGTGYVSARRLPAIGGGNALTSNPLSQFAATTSAQLAGVITDESGTGVALFDGFTLTKAVGATPTAMSSTAIDTTVLLQTRALAGDEVETFSTTPATGYKTIVEYTSDSSTRTVTLPLAGAVFCADLGTTGATFTVGANSSKTVIYERQSARWIAYGTGVLITGGGTNYFNITPDNTVGKVVRVTGTGTAAYGAVDLANSNAVTGNLPGGNGGGHLWSCTVDGGGSPLTTGVQVPIKIPFGFTVVGYTMTGSPSGSITVNIFRAANSAGLPTASIINNAGGGSGTGTLPAIASGVEGSSTTTTNWGSTTLTALDNLALNLTTVDGVMTKFTLILYGN